jgi:hypothetical protein
MGASVTSKRTDQEAFALLSAIGLTTHDAAIVAGDGEWIVLLLLPIKPPKLSVFDGWPIKYDYAHKGAWL